MMLGGHGLPRSATEAVGSKVSRPVLCPLPCQRWWDGRPEMEGLMDTCRPQKGEYHPDISSGVRGSPGHSCQSRGEELAPLLAAHGRIPGQSRS